MLREGDLHLPKKGWGRIVLAASASRAGTAWTGDGTARQERGLKHRADNETRTIPIPPELVRLLRAHIKRYGTTPDGRIFQTARGVWVPTILSQSLTRCSPTGPRRAMFGVRL
jgi:integrase